MDLDLYIEDVLGWKIGRLTFCYTGRIIEYNHFFNHSYIFCDVI